MYSAAVRVGDFLRKEFNVSLLGTGMHPFLLLEETGIWRHRDRRIFGALSQVFNLRQHGWLNIQSYQLNLPYADEEDGIWLHNAIVNLVPYLPAVASSSPIIESKVGRFLDNRLYFYGASQREIPSITGDVVPEYVASFEEYWRRVISTYSSDLRVAGAPAVLLNREWINSRGAIFRFDRRAIEIRVMDEQECIKMDVALSCFIRALLRGWLRDGLVHQSRDILISDYRAIIRDGLSAQVKHPRGKTARDVLLDFLTIARGSSTPDEREYLSLIERRVIQGSLSHMILRDTVKSAGERSFRDSVLEVYLTLIKCLRDNRPYF